jgi:predicted nucleic acid-binding protein
MPLWIRKDCMNDRRIAVDTSVLVGFLSTRDSLHAQAVALVQSLSDAACDGVYFDCVVGEALSVMARRGEEQRRQQDFEATLDKLLAYIPREQITWVSAQMAEKFIAITQLMREHQGALNFNDALIARACAEYGIAHIASFDADFDRVAGLRRVASVETVNDIFGSA